MKPNRKDIYSGEGWDKNDDKVSADTCQDTRHKLRILSTCFAPHLEQVLIDRCIS